MRKPPSQPSTAAARPLRSGADGAPGHRGARGISVDHPHYMQFFSRTKGGDLAGGVSGPAKNPFSFEYAPMRYIDPAIQTQNEDFVLNMAIDAKYLTARANAPLAARQLWGTDVYTADSDLLALLHHQGYIYLQDREPPEGMAQQFEPKSTMSARVVTLKRQVAFLVVEVIARKHDGISPFLASERNGLRSRAWSERFPDGLTIEIKTVRMFGPETEFLGLVSKPEKQLPLPYCISHIAGSRGPGIAHFDTGNGGPHGANAPPSAHPNGDGSNHNRSGTPGVAENYVPHKGAFTFSVSNEPMMSYSLSAVADGGFERNLFLSARLAKEVMILEDGGGQRFELCAMSNVSSTGVQVSFRWARIDNPIIEEIRSELASYPLALDKIKVLHEKLRWGQIVWTDQEVRVDGHRNIIMKFAFVDRQTELREK